ncbi:MAG TPA: hypothetical protein PK264_08925, partial [Hyphomicrobiaceae bacterium]|nr:hypothetical protein [Hyphomicrobiaceae bacterium]
MSYKTILLHLNDEHKVARLVNAALQIAEKFEAHVTALYVLPPVPTYGSMVMGSTIINSSMQGFRKEAERVKAAFDLACKGRTVVP